MRPTFRLVPDFIVPHLNRSTYGNHLHWEDKGNGSFKISRIHQSSDMWNEKCIEVYKAWSMKKKLWHPNDPKKITKAKHRLITALRRNPEIEMLEKESTFYRFRIVHPHISDNQLYQDSANQLLPHDIPQKNTDEIENYSISTDETKNRDMRNIPEDKTEQRDYSVFSEANTNLTYWSFPQSEFSDVQKMFSTNDDMLFGDELNSVETKTSVISDKCCCEKFLDTYLCDQKCIWHGMPP